MAYGSPSNRRLSISTHCGQAQLNTYMTGAPHTSPIEELEDIVAPSSQVRQHSLSDSDCLGSPHHQPVGQVLALVDCPQSATIQSLNIQKDRRILLGEAESVATPGDVTFPVKERGDIVKGWWKLVWLHTIIISSLARPVKEFVQAIRAQARTVILMAYGRTLYGAAMPHADHATPRARTFANAREPLSGLDRARARCDRTEPSRVIRSSARGRDLRQLRGATLREKRLAFGRDVRGDDPSRILDFDRTGVRRAQMPAKHLRIYADLRGQFLRRVGLCIGHSFVPFVVTSDSFAVCTYDTIKSRERMQGQSRTFENVCGRDNVCERDNAACVDNVVVDDNNPPVPPTPKGHDAFGARLCRAKRAGRKIFGTTNATYSGNTT